MQCEGLCVRKLRVFNEFAWILLVDMPVFNVCVNIQLSNNLCARGFGEVRTIGFMSAFS